MAQTIKHRRGSVASVRNITSFGEAEIVIGSGSVDGKVDGPIVYIGKPGGSTSANDYAPISKLYTGAGLPSITVANYGSTLDGLPYYDSSNKKIYILNSHSDGTSGHTEVILTKNSLQNFASEVSSSAAAAGFGGSGIFESISATLYKTQKNIQVSGSLEVSSSIKAVNVNVGTPTSNDWQANLGGSYFNNFTKDTDISEVLRFVAGLLSSSAANPTANTKTLGSVSETKTGNGTISTIPGHIPNNNLKDDLTYLIARGFATVGGTLFPGKTIYNQTGYNVSYNSVSAGSTSISSSNDTQLLGLGSLNSGAASEFQVKGTHAFRFNNNNSGTQTETSASTATLTNSSFSTSNGVTIAKIGTANPAVIPAAFQDGKFAGVHGHRIMGWTTEANTSVSASGTYILNSTIGIKTGSQAAFSDTAVSETIFWAPIASINTNIGNNSLTIGSTSVAQQTATSSSLSGAPYLSGGTWLLRGTVNGMFEPLYVASSTAVDVSIGSTSGYTISKTAGTDRLSTTGGTIQTAGMVVGNSGSPARNSGIPTYNDKVNISATYSISGTGNTITENGFSDTSYTLGMRAKNNEGAQTTLNTQTPTLHTAGTFGQVAARGSMGYFGGGTASSTLVERFTNETYRRIITTSTALSNGWNSATTLSNGSGKGLQVKPGYLVNHESANGYWYDDASYNAGHYKWYLREFDTNATNNKGTLTIDMNPNSSGDFVNFDSTAAHKISVGVIFGSSASTVFDAVKGNQSYGGSLNSTANGAMNPFSDSVDVKGDFSSITNSNGTLTLGLNNAGGQTINASNDKIWLLIRYKGTPSQTLEQITVSVS